MRRCLLLCVLTVGLACQSTSSSVRDAADGDGPKDTRRTDATIAFAAVVSPDPPKIGSNTLRLTLTAAGGWPVRKASLTVSYRMPIRPGMGGEATVQEEGDGVYVVSNLNFSMEGDWKVTVAVDWNQQAATQDFVFTLNR
jgi:hypothetical protein